MADRHSTAIALFSDTSFPSGRIRGANVRRRRGSGGTELGVTSRPWRPTSSVEPLLFGRSPRPDSPAPGRVRRAVGSGELTTTRRRPSCNISLASRTGTWAYRQADWHGHPIADGDQSRGG